MTVTASTDIAANSSGQVSQISDTTPASSFEVVNVRGASQKPKTFPIRKDHVILSNDDMQQVWREEQHIRKKMENLQDKLAIEKKVKEGAVKLAMSLKDSRQVYQELVSIHKREIDILNVLAAYALRLDQLVSSQKDHNTMVLKSVRQSRSKSVDEYETQLVNMYRLQSKCHLLSTTLEHQQKETEPLKMEVEELRKTVSSQQMEIKSLEASVKLLGYQNQVLTSYSTEVPTPPPRVNTSGDSSDTVTQDNVQKIKIDSSDTVTPETVKSMQVDSTPVTPDNGKNMQVDSGQGASPVPDQSWQEAVCQLLNCSQSEVLDKLLAITSSNQLNQELTLNLKSELKAKCLEKQQALNNLSALKVEFQAQTQHLKEVQESYVVVQEKLKLAEDDVQVLQADKLRLQASQALMQDELEKQHDLVERFDNLRAQSNVLMTMLEEEKAKK